MSLFKVVAPYKPAGDQIKAIEELVEGAQKNIKYQTLLGVTGSGKTFTVANVIEKLQKPTLVITHNKTLAAQLYSEFSTFLPRNAVEYFVSYYDYYQPEAYIPSTDTYIAKDASINDEIERLRIRATTSLLTRRDTVIVASVSCIYSLGSPAEYKDLTVLLKRGENIERNEILKKLITIQYRRNDIDFDNGTFRVRGDVVEIRPPYEMGKTAVRIDMYGDEIEKISRINVVKNEVIENLESILIFPAEHFVTSASKIEEAVLSIQQELEIRLKELTDQNKLVEAQRLESRTKYDIEMLREIGYCSGIENYSRHFDKRPQGSRPFALLDFYPKDFLVIIDESHVTIPQLKGMYEGDKSRKQKLVEYGFRLPSALDNRPLIFSEFDSIVNQIIFVSATPGELEFEKSKGVVVEQVIRPTGLVDPEIIIKPVKGQIDDLMNEIHEQIKKKERTLVTTLTKRMSEDLAEYLRAAGIKVSYLHSEIETLERSDIIRDLRLGIYDVLVGINLLREGLDIPETSLVAILDADKEGFLRSTTSLIQTAGRASRNINGRVILYADKITQSMERAINEVNRRREKQVSYNKENGIIPKTTIRPIEDKMGEGKEKKMDYMISENISRSYKEKPKFTIESLRNQMLDAASKMEFEKAAKIRDKIKELQNRL